MALKTSQRVQMTPVLDKMANAQLEIMKDATARNRIVPI
jgi:hypothetical protein